MDNVNPSDTCSIQYLLQDDWHAAMRLNDPRLNGINLFFRSW